MGRIGKGGAGGMKKARGLLQGGPRTNSIYFIG